MASPNLQTRVWVNSRNWWWTGRSGVLQSMGSQRVGDDWVTEVNWTGRWDSFPGYLWPSILIQSPSWLHSHCSAKMMAATMILGGSPTHGVSFCRFPNSSRWWWLLSSMFFTRISGHKTTHENCCYGAWPGLAVSISVLPLTLLKANQWVFTVLIDKIQSPQFPNFLQKPISLLLFSDTRLKL